MIMVFAVRERDTYLFREDLSLFKLGEVLLAVRSDLQDGPGFDDCGDKIPLFLVKDQTTQKGLMLLFHPPSSVEAGPVAPTKGEVFWSSGGDGAYGVGVGRERAAGVCCRIFLLLARAGRKQSKQRFLTAVFARQSTPTSEEGACVRREYSTLGHLEMVARIICVVHASTGTYNLNVSCMVYTYKGVQVYVLRTS